MSRTMTATVEPVALWRTRPGWGIAADLTPPELINSRELKVLRRLLGAGLVILMIICVGGYVLAARHRSAALAENNREQVAADALQSDLDRYGGITRMQGTVTQVQAQIATVMASDVDLAQLMARLSSSLPARMTIGSESVVISTAAATGATGAIGATGATGPAAAAQSIGTVTLSGGGRTVDDLATYVDKLALVPGVIDVVPTTTSLSSKGMQYSVALVLTGAVLSHRFDLPTRGTK